MATTSSMYGAGATLSAAGAGVILPLALAGMGGAEVGYALSDAYKLYSGQSIGADIYDYYHPDCPGR
jgi:hypothetical protein